MCAFGIIDECIVSKYSVMYETEHIMVITNNY